jgi:NADH:ubiquinone reductase (non-electrogenic)
LCSLPLQEVSDARKIRNRILANFELATQPGVSRDEQERLLHLVIVGGGPTGVEFGAEFYDFLKQDVSRLYQSEREMVKVTIIEAKQILSSFDKHLQEYAEAKIRKRRQMEILQDSVTEVTSRSVKLKSGAVLSCGLVVWSAGLAPRCLVHT